ncbi:extracellular solute-binding protein [Paenibacillus chitinolyticus]
MAKWKKGVSLTLITVLSSIAVLSGCSSDSKPNATDAGKQGTAQTTGVKFGEQQLDISFYGNYDWFTMPVWGQDLATKWVKENKKVNVTGVPNGGNSEQKFNTLMASKELPDVIWLERGAQVEKLRAAGMLVSFDEYLDKYPNLKKWAGEATLNMLRSSDGKLYQFPNWYTQRPAGNAGYMINLKIYKELGEPKLETYDDLYAYLKQVKAKYPDVTPFDSGVQAQNVEIMYPGFANDHPVTNINMRAVPEGNELKSIFADPVYRESLTYSSKLFREKLITQDVLTQTKDQIDEKVNNGKVAVMAASSVTEFGSKGTTALQSKDPSHPGYQMIWPIHKEGVDKTKVFPGHYATLGWNVNVITKSAKNPEAIFAFLDWMTGEEGQRVMFWGPEGEYWQGTDEKGTPKFTDKYYSDATGRAKLMDSLVNLQWVGNTTYIDTAKTDIELKLPAEKQSWETRNQTQVAWKTVFNRTEFVNLDPPSNTEEGMVQQRIKDIFTESRAKALFAKSDAEVTSILDKAEKDAQAAGYAKLLKYQTERWQENKKKIGK